MQNRKQSTLRQARSLNWWMIATLGIAFVIAGQFSGWNYGLRFGWPNLAAATGLMFLFYIGLLQCLSEMAATWPSAGGLANFSRLAFGDMVGGLLSVSLALGLVACAGAVANFIAAYAATVIGTDPLLLRLLVFLGVLVVHLRGTKEAIWVVVLAGFVAVLTLLLFAGESAPYVALRNFEMAEHPLSLTGAIAAVPYALWLFLGVEQAVTASEEAANPAKDLPRGLMLALLVLGVTAIGVIICAPGAGGSAAIAQAGDPLLVTIAKLPNASILMTDIIGAGAIFGLLASFFSVTYTASRQIYDLARSGFFPATFGRANAAGTPVQAFIAVAIGGAAMSMLSPDRILLAAVLLFTAAYFLTALAFLRLRVSKAGVERPYRAAGGMVTGVLTLLASLAVFYACFNIDVVILLVVAASFVFAAAQRLIFTRKQRQD